MPCWGAIAKRNHERYDIVGRQHTQGQHGGGPETVWALRPKLQTIHTFYLQSRHSRGTWWSRDTWGTLWERTQSQRRKRAPCHNGWEQCQGGKAATGGKTKETSHTHLRARLRGAAHPQSRSTLGGSGGRKRRGEVIGNVYTKHRAAWEGGWLGHEAWQGLLPTGTR